MIFITETKVRTNFVFEKLQLLLFLLKFNKKIHKINKQMENNFFTLNQLIYYLFIYLV
jgi:hypothetical protein